MPKNSEKTIKNFIDESNWQVEASEIVDNISQTVTATQNKIKEQQQQIQALSKKLDELVNKLSGMNPNKELNNINSNTPLAIIDLPPRPENN